MSTDCLIWLGDDIFCSDNNVYDKYELNPTYILGNREIVLHNDNLICFGKKKNFLVAIFIVNFDCLILLGIGLIK